MTEPEEPTPPQDTAFALIEGIDPVIAACAGVKTQCVARGFTEESGEQVALEILLEAVRRTMQTARPSAAEGFLDRLARRAR